MPRSRDQAGTLGWEHNFPHANRAVVVVAVAHHFTSPSSNTKSERGTVYRLRFSPSSVALTLWERRTSPQRLEPRTASISPYLPHRILLRSCAAPFYAVRPFRAIPLTESRQRTRHRSYCPGEVGSDDVPIDGRRELVSQPLQPMIVAPESEPDFELMLHLCPSLSSRKRFCLRERPCAQSRSTTGEEVERLLRRRDPSLCRTVPAPQASKHCTKASRRKNRGR